PLGLAGLQIPTREDASKPVAFVLKNETQSSSAIGSTIQNVNIIESTLVPGEFIIVEKTLLRFFWLNSVIAQMLHISILLVLVIPLKLVPTMIRHWPMLIHLWNGVKVFERVFRALVGVYWALMLFRIRSRYSLAFTRTERSSIVNTRRFCITILPLIITVSTSEAFVEYTSSE